MVTGVVEGNPYESMKGKGPPAYCLHTRCIDESEHLGMSGVVGGESGERAREGSEKCCGLDGVIIRVKSNAFEEECGSPSNIGQSLLPRRGHRLQSTITAKKVAKNQRDAGE